MAKIYRTNDIISLKIDGLVVNISPLTFEQKMQIQTELMLNASEGPMRAAKLACQYAIKDIKGLEDADGSEYKLEFENNKVSDKCWDDLQNVQETNKMITACLNLVNGVPSEFVDPQTGKKIEGVSIIKEASKAKKK